MSSEVIRGREEQENGRVRLVSVSRYLDLCLGLWLLRMSLIYRGCLGEEEE